MLIVNARHGVVRASLGSDLFIGVKRAGMCCQSSMPVEALWREGELLDYWRLGKGGKV